MNKLELLLSIYEKRQFNTWHPYCRDGGYHVELNKLYNLGMLQLVPVSMHDPKGTAYFTPRGMDFINTYNALLA